jgi:hypothetical protein
MTCADPFAIFNRWMFDVGRWAFLFDLVKPRVEDLAVKNQPMKAV